MTTAAVITGCLNAVILALTPLERWAAARKFNSDFMSQRWFVLIGIIAILMLTVLLFVVSFNRNRREQKASGLLFVEYAGKRGLAAREREIILEVAHKAGLKRSESVFTLGDAFDRGAAKMIEESLVDQQATEGSRQLKAELYFLREKLGFRKQQKQKLSAGSSGRPAKLSSRQIPAGKKVHVTRRKSQDTSDIESTVVKNSDNELSIRLTRPVKITLGEFWCVRYYSGSSVWEFDTSVVSYDGDILVLNHSDNVRFINRRRFLRVPVKRPALIARFPFTRPPVEPRPNGNEGPVMSRDLTTTSAAAWGPPEFVPAVVTELAGPGLRAESALEVKEGDRILVIFDLEQQQDSIPASAGRNPAARRIVQGIGEVRRTKRLRNGLSIAIELTGLSDSNVNELTRATNAASLSAAGEDNNTPISGDAVGRIPEHVGV